MPPLAPPSPASILVSPPGEARERASVAVEPRRLPRSAPPACALVVFRPRLLQRLPRFSASRRFRCFAWALRPPLAENEKAGQREKKKRVKSPTNSPSNALARTQQAKRDAVLSFFCLSVDAPVHCDEALACAMLKMLPEWSDAAIVRTRDEAELAKCDAVVDVGGVYDPGTLR